MKWLTIKLMNLNFRIALNKQSKQENEIVKRAYNDLIKSYKNTIMFLEADLKNNKTK